MPTLDERVNELEINLLEMSEGMRDLKIGQLRIADQVRVVGDEQKEAVRQEGERVTKELLAQNQAILKVAQNLSAFQATFNKWAAAAALLGSVMLFICARALGLG